MHKQVIYCYTLDIGLLFIGADREVQRILLELLNQMDGFDQGSNVKVYNSEYSHSLSIA